MMILRHYDYQLGVNMTFLSDPFRRAFQLWVCTCIMFTIRTVAEACDDDAGMKGDDQGRIVFKGAGR